jgi:four helix bundle protein
VPSSYRDLIVWQRAKLLAVEVTRLTQTFPKTELFALGSQLRRAAVSVPSNIAEGQGRLSRGEFRQFLGTARGSLLEVSTQLEIAYDLGYMDDRTWNELAGKASEVLFLLNRLIKSLQPGRRSTSETSETCETSETVCSSGKASQC